MRWLQRLRASPAPRHVPVAELMEPRLLYSADLAAGLVLGADTQAANEQRTLDASGEYAAADTTASALATYAQTGLRFEQNVGQGGAGAEFVAGGSGYGIALAGGNADLTLATDTGAQT